MTQLTAPYPVAVVGVGNMGGAMAARLLAEGWPVQVHDIDPRKYAALLSAGADAARAVADWDGGRDGPVARSLALLGAAVDPRRDASRRAAVEALDRALSRVSQSREDAHRARARVARALRTRPLSLLFPPRAFMAARYGVPESSRWLPLLYVVRPFRGLFRALTGM